MFRYDVLEAHVWKAYDDWTCDKIGPVCPVVPAFVKVCDVNEYRGISSELVAVIVDCWYANGSGEVPHVNPSVLRSPPPRFVKIPPLNADLVVVENGRIVDTIGTL